MSDDVVEAPAEAGAPMWMVTFADLSTLLLCFFVLLLSFSEMDVAKFKQLAGSMRQAFGVQADIKAKQIPKGTSIIAREFSPGEPAPTALNQVRQFTIDSTKNTLKFTDPAEFEKLKDKMEREEQAKAESNRIAEGLREEIDQGKVIVRAVGSTTVIHILERGSFELGGADIQPGFYPVLRKIRRLLIDTDGIIRVAGHTDSLPIRTLQYPSNWALSSARAVSVAHVLMKNNALLPERFVVAGHADTKPIGDNSTPEGRALNRRIDVTLFQGDDYFAPSADLDEPGEPELPLNAEPPAE